jgi:CubicO group peptidase (beta-lactamase class C family)
MSQLNRDSLARLRGVLQDHIDRQRIPGAIAVVALGGHVESFECLGRLDPATGAAMREDAIFRIYSMTKPLVSLMTMMLAEEGRLQLIDPVSAYLPVFANAKVSTGAGQAEPARRAATVQDLLRHTAGLTYEFTGSDPVQQQYETADIGNRSRSNPEFCQLLASIPAGLGAGHLLAVQPGDRCPGCFARSGHRADAGRAAARAHLLAAGHERHGLFCAAGPVDADRRTFRDLP